MMKSSRKYVIASRMLWMTFSLTFILLLVAWAVDDQQGETVREAIKAIATMWPWTITALGSWFGVSIVGSHWAQNRPGNGTSSEK